MEKAPTLSQIVKDGAERLSKLEELGMSATTDEIDACVKILERASELVVNLFRQATSMDEVSDDDIECLSAPYYLGKAVQRMRVPPSERLALINRSKRATRDFVELAARLSDDEDERWEDEEEGDKSAAAMRAAALARYEKRREIELRVEEADDDRERAILELLARATRAVQDLRMQDREIEMLEAMNMGGARRNDTVPRARHGDAAWLSEGRPEDGLRVLKITNGAGDGPESSSLNVRREQIRSNAFTPDPRRLPTVSLEEAAKAELEDALRRQEREKTPKPPISLEEDNRRTSQLEEDGDEDDMVRYDMAAKRDEAWDTWKEHHPPGSGNKGDHIY